MSVMILHGRMSHFYINALGENNYLDFIKSLKQKILVAQQKAIIAVNRELIFLYWEVGQIILERQKTDGIIILL